MQAPHSSSESISASPSLETAIHIGAGTVSLLIAGRNESGALQPVDYLEKPAPVARDIFRTGKVSLATTERLVAIIHQFQQVLVEFGLAPTSITRAAATNLLNEAKNQETVINRILVACGIRVEPIDDGEMTRLIYLKTRRRLQQFPVMRKNTTLVLHVGPGNTRALLFQEGRITRYTSYRMGVHRTREAVEASHAVGPALQRVIREHASGNLAQIRFDYSDPPPNALVTIGYELQAVATQLCGKQSACSTKTLRQFSADTANLTDIEIVKRFQVDYQTAEALLPAMEINLAVAEALRLPEVLIPDSTYELGLLQDLLVSRDLTDTFAEEVLRSARILADRYQSDASHGEHVRNLCVRFFQELADLHQLTPHDALLLQVAAILHEVGTYISPRAHHKHSEYVILNSEIFGLDRLDVAIVSQISRYHRHATPSLDHPGYAALSSNDRIRVCKLAALLRVADALERTHAQRVSEIVFTRTSGRLHLRLPGLADAAVERLAMSSKADLFEQIYGLSVTIDPEN